jgi:hypothetical protein
MNNLNPLALFRNPGADSWPVLINRLWLIGCLAWFVVNFNQNHFLRRFLLTGLLMIAGTATMILGHAIVIAIRVYFARKRRTE